MDTRIIAVLAAGILATILLSVVSIYLGGIAIIIVAAVVMTLLIMQDSSFLPQVDIQLREDAKAVVLMNKGNAPAEGIHVALVPLNIEYDVAVLSVDESHEFALQSMLAEAKAVVTFSNGNGRTFSLVKQLSSSGEFDPLKPTIPIFGWK
ncbi:MULTISPECIES: hypothetical protein [unclassified Methanoregula]|uniref:hypothetical protein n=1 Tax=unclassified Methanoregula TaxID=2649730 RepID=UPI0009D196F6|nr:MULTISPECIES: hypothetical protein [unclassified Methanoregula]OPX65388.1 MAG: hypothetical protein A4E33_00421 [Methanoregula sp. PtaB.Bin085]OPY32297.1 MAG: hypothetical protein A4E34_02671 [Methanoregula sp. PtaU1.Bin006]